jgi:hypothetical protein
MLTLVNSIVRIVVNLIAPPVVQQGLGPALYVAYEGATPISGDLTSVSSAEDIATLLAATQITAQAATDLGAAIQNGAPIVYVATYDHDAGSPETPDDALDRANAAIDFCLIAQESRSNADNETVGTWLNASSLRRWTHIACLQSGEAGLLTSGRPSALEDCELPTVQIEYHGTATEPQAAAVLGRMAAQALTVSPLARRLRILGVALTTITSSQLAFAKANGAGVLLPVGDGSAASDRQIDQTLMYDGSQGAPVYSIVYSVRRMLSEVKALLSARGISGVPIRADRTGAASVDTALNAALAPMARVGHFLPGRAGTAPNDRALPNGYDVVTTPSGTELLSRVTQLYGPEATAIAITDDGIVVVEA